MIKKGFSAIIILVVLALIIIGGGFILFGKNSASFDTQDAPLTVLSPNGGEKWEQGSAHIITWQTPLASSISSVDIFLSYYYQPCPKEGPCPQYELMPSYTVIESTPNDGQFEWVIPQRIAPGDYLVRIFEARKNPDPQVIPAGQLYDQSDAPFTITASPEMCPQAYDPVCGVDGNTYANDCIAKTKHIEIKQKGACEETPKPAVSECRKTGCNGSICAQEDTLTTCDYRPEYACYQNARCEKQTDGQCGWTQTPELQACIDNAKKEEIKSSLPALKLFASASSQEPCNLKVSLRWTASSDDARDDVLRCSGTCTPSINDNIAFTDSMGYADKSIVAGNLYTYMVHIRRQGEDQYSNAVSVTPSCPKPQTPQEEAFSLEADDSGFYPSPTITVPRGIKVKLTFNVRTTNVYYGGLDFRSSKFTTGQVMPGKQTTVEFTVDEAFVISSYWPASGVKKADLNVALN